MASTTFSHTAIVNDASSCHTLCEKCSSEVVLAAQLDLQGASNMLEAEDQLERDVFKKKVRVINTRRGKVPRPRLLTIVACLCVWVWIYSHKGTGACTAPNVPTTVSFACVNAYVQSWNCGQPEYNNSTNELSFVTVHKVRCLAESNHAHLVQDKGKVCSNSLSLS